MPVYNVFHGHVWAKQLAETRVYASAWLHPARTRAWHVLSVPFCGATVATRHNGTKCAKFNAPRKRNQMIGSVSRPHTAQKETTKL